MPSPEYATEILPEHLPDGMLSIAVFGPGEGEAIVVRLPDGSIGVVDGCREPRDGNPEGIGDPVRELLTKLEASSPKSHNFTLEFVCLTHPHTDHYRGLGRLIEAYAGRIRHLWTVTHATPKYERALPEWLELIRTGDAPDAGDLEGLTRVLAAFHEEKKRVQTLNPSGFSQLSHQKPLFRRAMHGHELAIDACGPADDDIDDAQKELTEILDVAAKCGTISRKHDPNLTSGALLLRWGSAAVLLAGDLLRGRGLHSGWQRVRGHITGEVQVVNVAHHASEAAHDNTLWASMRPALAIVTPFKLGKVPNPPRPEQIAALARTAVVAITSPPEWGGERNRPFPLRSRGRRNFAAKNGVITIVPKAGDSARRNAVGVTLDAAGGIRRLVLTGSADVYLARAKKKAKMPPKSKLS
ncbi:MBL fold metallo-hydrolase [Sorangium sp. So ce726]|uniref:MBL fold metallo-hydrolase n=1 Tax=Sorangium sp. So ce726 TaxID=3133319 RepID=UPI003F612F88